MPKTRQKPMNPGSNCSFFRTQRQSSRKIRQKLHHSVPSSDSDTAEPQYLRDREYLQAGKKLPQMRSD